MIRFHVNEKFILVRTVNADSGAKPAYFFSFFCLPVGESGGKPDGSVKLTLRRLMSYIYIYIYGAPILDVSRSHTTTQHSR